MTSSSQTHDEPLIERISVFMLRKRQFPGHSHEAFAVGKYYLLDKIDEGAMGIVCTALEQTFGTVALKFPKLIVGPRVRERIIEEGKLLSRVHHTNVLRVYEVGQADDSLFIATEYVEGETLRSWQTAPGRGWRDVVGAYLQGGHGLAAIHARQIVHQDIKPDNIRVDRAGTVRILDFGLAHLESRTRDPMGPATLAPPTAPRSTFHGGGTPGYMAPEQFHHGAPVNARADQFSYCVALWEALHGVMPYTADAIRTTSCGGKRPLLGAPAGDRSRHVPTWLRAILLRGLNERAELRYPTMDALLAAIERRMNSRRTSALLLAGATGLLGAGVAATLSGPLLPMCADQGDPFAGRWDDRRDREVESAIRSVRDPAAAQAWSGTRAALAAHRRAWLDVHATLCHQAAAAGDPQILSTRQACLEEGRDDAALVVDGVLRFAESHADDAAADWAAQHELWVQQLGRTDDCLAPRPAQATITPPASAALRAGRAAILAGDREDAVPRLEQAILAADREGDRLGRARAHLELGRMAIAGLATGSAETHLVHAFRDAEAAADDLLAVDAASLLVLLESDQSDHPAAAVPWSSLAMGRLERLGLTDSPRALELEIREAKGAVRVGRLVEAEAALARAAALRERLGEHPHQHAREEQLRAAILERRGDPVGAAALARSAAERLTRLYGEDSTIVANALRMLGSELHKSGDMQAAEDVWLRALAVHERRGPDCRAAAALSIHLAGLYYQQDRIERARGHAALAGECVDRWPSDVQPALQADASAIRGLLELQYTHDYAAAATHFTRGLASAGDSPPSPEEAFNRAEMRLGLVQAELLGGRPADARAAMLPLLDSLARDERIAPLRPYILQTAAELDLATNDRLAAERSSREALAALSSADRQSSLLAADLEWILARALGPRHSDGRAAAGRSLAILRRQPIPPTASLQPAEIEVWLTNDSHGPLTHRKSG